MAILDFSKDSDKSIAIHFHTRELGPQGQPLYYHTPENPAGNVASPLYIVHSYNLLHFCLVFPLLTEHFFILPCDFSIIVIKGHVEFRTVKETNGSDISFTFEARAESKWTGNTSTHLLRVPQCSSLFETFARLVDSPMPSNCYSCT
jgi:hypothetical protein